MARNFEGLGLDIDVSTGKSAENVDVLGKSLSGLWTGLEKAGKVAASAGRGIGQKVTGGLGAIRGGLGRLGYTGSRVAGTLTTVFSQAVDSAMNPQLDTAYSSMYATFDKGWQQMASGMNMTSEESKKMAKVIGSTAFALNADMEGTSKSWMAFRQQNVDLQRVLGSKGTKGAIKDLIKVTDVFGIEGDQLASTMSGLKYGFGFTEEQLKATADEISYVGKQFGMGREAMQGFSTITQALNTELADWGENLPADKVKDMLVQVTMLSGGLKEAAGLTGESATQLATTVFTTMAKERKGLLDLARGLGSDFGDVTKRLIETGGDVETVFGELQQGNPLRFMDMMREMMVLAKKQGGEMSPAFQRLSAVISESLGPDATFAMKGTWDGVKGKIEQVTGDLAKGKAADNLRKVANEAYRSGLTAGDAWERMTESMKAQLFGLSDKDVRQWTKNMKKGFGETFEDVKRFAKDDGPLGELTRKFLLVQRVGISGLIPALGPISPMLAGIASNAFPAMTAMGAMGIKFQDIGKMALGGGLLYGLFYLLKHGPKEAWANLQKFSKDLWKSFSNLFPDLSVKVSEFYEKLKGGDVLEMVKSWYSGSKVKEVVEGFSRMFERIDWGKVAGFVMRGLTGLSQLAGSVFRRLVTDIDWGKIFGNLIEFAIKGLQALGGLVKTFLVEVFAAKDPATGKAISDGFLDILGGAISMAMDKIPSLVGGAIRGLFKGLFSDGLSGALKTMGGVLTGALILSKAFRGKFLTLVKGLMFDFTATVRAGAMGGVTGFAGGIKKMGSALRSFGKMIGGLGIFMGVMEGMEQFKKRSVEIGDILNDKLIPDVQKTAMVGEQAFMGVANTINSVFLGLPGMIGSALGISEKDLSGFYYEMVAGVEKAISFVVETISAGLNSAGYMFNGLKAIIGNVWDYLGSKIEAFVSEGAGMIISFREKILNVFYSIGESIELALSTIGDVVMRPFTIIGYKLREWMFSFADDLLSNPMVSTALKAIIGDETYTGMTKMIKDYKKALENERGGYGTIGEKLDADFEQKQTGIREKYQQKRDETASVTAAAMTIAKQQRDKALEAAETAKNLIKSNAVGVLRDVQKEGMKAQETYGQMARDIDKDLERSVIESDKRRKKVGEAQTDVTQTLEETIKGKTQRASKKQTEPKAVPTPESQASVRGSDALSSLAYTMSGVSMALGRFVEKPLDVKVNIEGDIKKLLKVVEKGNGPTSATARAG